MDNLSSAGILLSSKEEGSFIIPTQYWHRLEDGRVQCDVCPRFCKLHKGQRGFCFVRANEDNQIVFTSYGLSSGFCIDPIEKKPLYHFLPGTAVLSFGTAGCNLSCKFCQNWNVSKSRETDTLSEEASPEVIAFAAKKLGCKSVAYTYNDPTIFMEYAMDVALACREFGIKSVAVTAGYICKEPRREFYQYIDAANVDLKGFTESFYEKITGSQLQPVLETLIYLRKETKVWFEITNLLIPGENDSEKEMEEMTQWIVENLGGDVPLHFSAFHPDWKMIEYPSTPLSTLIRARQIALKNGLSYVYTGNIPYEEGESTYCSHCTKVLIVRNQYKLIEYNITESGRCQFCSFPFAGLIDPACPGHWGNRRLPIQIKDFASQFKPTHHPPLHEIRELHHKTHVFKDRVEAGKVLAQMLKKYKNTNTCVLAIPSGGVPVAQEISKQLQLPLDLAIVSKITFPWNTEAGFGAVTFNDFVELNQTLISQAGLKSKAVEAGIQRTRQKVKRRMLELRQNQPFPSLIRKTLILVDDGLASGFTLKAAIKALRKEGAQHIVLAIPTAHDAALQKISQEVEAVYCPNIRSGFHFAVAEAYEEWKDVSEEEVKEILGEK